MTEQQVVYINQEISSEEEDLIGINSQVESIKSAVDQGAKMIGIIADYGTGKSSVVELFNNRYNNQKKAEKHVPKYETKEKERNEIIEKIDLLLDNSCLDNKNIITWRNQYYAHIDKRWFSENYLKAASDDLCITAYNMEHLIEVLEPLLVNICQLFDVDIQALRIESDAEKFLEIIRAGENYLA